MAEVEWRVAMVHKVGTADAEVEEESRVGGDSQTRPRCLVLLRKQRAGSMSRPATTGAAKWMPKIPAHRSFRRCIHRASFCTKPLMLISLSSRAITMHSRLQRALW